MQQQNAEINMLKQRLAQMNPGQREQHIAALPDHQKRALQEDQSAQAQGMQQIHELNQLSQQLGQMNEQDRQQALASMPSNKRAAFTQHQQMMGLAQQLSQMPPQQQQQTLNSMPAQARQAFIAYNQRQQQFQLAQMSPQQQQQMMMQQQQMMAQQQQQQMAAQQASMSPEEKRQEKIKFQSIYPAYIDANFLPSEGRKLNKKHCCQGPHLDEIFMALKQMGFTGMFKDLRKSLPCAQSSALMYPPLQGCIKVAILEPRKSEDPDVEEERIPILAAYPNRQAVLKKVAEIINLRPSVDRSIQDHPDRSGQGAKKKAQLEDAKAKRALVKKAAKRK